MRTREAAKILRTERDPERLAKQVYRMGMDTYKKAREFNQKAGLDYHQASEKEVKVALKESRINLSKRPELEKRECFTRSIRRNVLRSIVKREAQRSSDNRFWRRKRFKALWSE